MIALARTCRDDRCGYVAIIAVALIASVPQFLWGPGLTDSYRFNLIWTDGMAQPEVYPRWFNGSFEGLGSPTFFFYPPLFFVLSGKLHQLGLSVEAAVNVATAVVLASSGLAMSVWLRARGASAWWALLYMLLPYHLADLYDRGALAEFAAYIWPPFIAVGIHWLPHRKGAALLAGSVAALILTHLPLALLTLVFVVPPLIIAKTVEDARAMRWAIGSVVTGIALSAGYLLPALGLLKYINAQLLTAPYYQPGHWSIWATASSRPPAQISRLLVAAAAAILALAARGRRLWAGLTVLLGVFAIGAVPFWLIAPLDRVQFPWRLIELQEFTAVTALALAPSLRLRELAIAGCLAAPFIGMNITGAVIALRRTSPTVRANILKSMPDGAEYAPRGFPTRQASEAIERVDSAPFARLPSPMEPIKVLRSGEVIVRRFNFPIWRVLGPSGQVCSYSTKPYGLLAFKAVPGTYRVQRIAHPLERMGWTITLVTFSCAVAFGLTQSRRPRGPSTKLQSAVEG